MSTPNFGRKYYRTPARHAGGAPSTISRIISRAKVSSSPGTYTVVSLPCFSTRTGISFSFSAWLKKLARASSEPDHTAQVGVPKLEGFTAAAGAASSSAGSSISTGSSPSNSSRIFSAPARSDEATETSNPNLAFQSIGRISAVAAAPSPPVGLSIYGIPAASNFSNNDECSAGSSPAHNIINDPSGPGLDAIIPSIPSTCTNEKGIKDTSNHHIATYGKPAITQTARLTVYFGGSTVSGSAGMSLPSRVSLSSPISYASFTTASAFSNCEYGMPISNEVFALMLKSVSARRNVL